MRTGIVLLAVATWLPAQKLAFLHSLDAGAPDLRTPGVAADTTGVYTINVSGSRIVLRKFDAAGSPLWANQSGEAHWRTATIAVAGDGIYVAGSVDGAAPGQTGAGGYDVYLARYDLAGTQLWIRQFGTSGDDEVGGIAADANGVYVASATWIFAQQNYAASLRKYSREGNLLWTRDFTGLAFWSMPLAADDTSLYLAAAAGQDGKPWFNGQPVFAWLRKYTPEGGQQWVQPVSATPGGISGLATDTSGIYAVLESFSGGNDSLVRKYDTDGNELWVSSLGGLASPGLLLRAVAVDAAGLYVSGSVRTSLPGQCYAGNSDAVVRKYDTSSGDEIWTREFGTYQPDAVAGLAPNDNAVFVVAGPNLAKLVTAPAADSAAQILNECVLNAASNIGGGVVPGEIVTVLVTGPVTRLMFNGVPAPILAASDIQVTAIVPFELAGQTSVDVQVESQGIASENVTLPVLPDRLGVFSADKSGNGQVAVVNEDGSLNSPSHPAQPGSAISLYATGGSAATTVAVAVSNEIIAFPEVDGGEEDYRYYAPILYAGSTAGLLQINVRLPAGVPSGSAVALHVMSAGAPIEQSLTIAIAQ